MLSQSELSLESLSEFKGRLKTSLEDAQFAYKVAKARQSAYSSHKYQSPEYKVGDMLWINKTLFTDAYSRSQASDKLTAKKYGPFQNFQVIGRNAVKLELPAHFRIQPVVHVSHTTPYVSQLVDIRADAVERPEPVPAVDGDENYVEAILKHRKRGRGYQFLTLMKGSPIHDAEWQPTSDFVDRDGTVTDVCQKYIKETGILPQQH